jgi:hypothetical protein
MRQPSSLAAKNWIVARQLFFAALSAGTMLLIGHGMFSMLQTNGSTP